MIKWSWKDEQYDYWYNCDIINDQMGNDFGLCEMIYGLMRNGSGWVHKPWCVPCRSWLDENYKSPSMCIHTNCWLSNGNVMKRLSIIKANEKGINVNL